MKTSIPFLACAILCWSPSAEAESYDARIADQEILTPLPSATPRINGPVLYGARPNKQFVYRIPTQGERPMKFEVKGLPAGLTLDADQGVITGVTPGKMGNHAMTLVAKNRHGEASLPFKLVVGDKLALTPPVGWNSWGGHMLTVTDQVMRKAADMIVDKGLADVGFQYVTLWSMIAAPFFFSCDINTIDEFTIRLLANSEVVGINQDELGQVAVVVRQTDDEVVMVKQLAGGARALALFNLNATRESEIKLDPEWLGKEAPGTILDGWRHQTVPHLKSGDAVRLSPNGVALFIIK